MSEITPELKLTYLDGSNPKHYSLNVTIDGQAAHPDLIISNDGGNMLTPNSQYVISLELGQAENGAQSIDVNIGQIQFDTEESLIEVQIMRNGNLVGEGHVRVKEANQETRPIGKDL